MEQPYLLGMHTVTEIVVIYEGSPSKSWTFVIKRDENLYDIFIYILDILCTNMNGITDSITKL